jgi:hypothetical protein
MNRYKELLKIGSTRKLTQEEVEEMLYLYVPIAFESARKWVNKPPELKAAENLLYGHFNPER